MFRHLLANITLAAAIGGAIPVAPMSAASEKQHALTHVAFIPEGSDLNSVRFEKVKTLKIRATAADTESCEDLAAREHRSASAECPQADAMTSVYEVTYSYSGQPMASDEYGNRHFTFQVYFRPDELSPAARKALSAAKIKRADVASYFAVKTAPESQKKAGEESQMAVPSGFVFVKVESTSSLRVSGSASAENNK